MSEIKRKTNPFYRRLLLAYLIENGVNSVEQILSETKWPKRTLQSVLKTMSDYGIEIVVEGGTIDRRYNITSWGAINKQWVKDNLQHIKNVLEY